jgi:subtilisin family serine protease
VAVLDTPIYPHTRLAGRYISAPGSLLPVDGGVRPWSAGHATFVAGLILQQAPAAELRIESVLDADGSTVDVWTVARRLVRYADLGFDVMNLSFGCFTIDGRPPLVLERAIGRITPNTVVVAAAGNYGDPDSGLSVDELPKPTTPIWPAAFDEAVAVGALDGEKPAVFNSTGAWVKLMAPGVDVQSTYLIGEVTGHDSQDAPEERETFQGMAQWSGSSFAAAVVTGAIAALTVPGQRSAYEALELIRERAGQNGIGIRLP